MNKFYCLLLACLCGGVSLRAESAAMPTNQQSLSFERKITKSVTANYLLFLPHDYNKDKNRKWPVMLFLHGAGERGTNLTKVAVHGPPKIVQKRADFPFILVSPQCPEGGRWENDVLLGLLDEVISTHRVDAERVYLTGLSMGGYGTWSLGLSHPDLFAAIVPICGGGDSVKVLLADPQKAASLKTLPVWAFHGAKDNAVKLEESQRMVEALKKIGNEAQLTVYPDAGHDSWTQTYDNEEVYQWMLGHNRAGASWKTHSVK